METEEYTPSQKPGEEKNYVLADLPMYERDVSHIDLH